MNIVGLVVYIVVKMMSDENTPVRAAVCKLSAYLGSCTAAYNRKRISEIFLFCHCFATQSPVVWVVLDILRVYNARIVKKFGMWSFHCSALLSLVYNVVRKKALRTST
jgi:hypothetical protein